MNYPTLLLSSLICLFVFLLIFIPFASGYDYFPNNVYTLKENSVVCVVDPPREHLFNILKAVNSWDSYMHSNWYTVKVIHVELFDCDATVVFDNPMNIFDDTDNEFGVTKCWDKPILGQLGRTVVTDRYCRAVVNLEITDTWYITVQHETGHIIGLGHRMPYEVKDFAFVFFQHDLMFPLMDNQVKITDESIIALQYFRDNPQLEANYTIPHP